MDDPYKTLGIKKSATAAEIKSAYRKLAKQHHPDLNSGNAERFKNISGAYDVLSDKDKRERYDRGEFDIGQRGQRPGAGFWKNWSDGSRGNGQGNSSHSFNFDQFGGSGGDIFSEIFRGNSQFDAGASRKASANKRREVSRDSKYKLKVPFIEAAVGIKKKVTLSDGKTVNMTIPPGSETGTKLRLKGQGKTINGEVSKGDAIIDITVEDHDYFNRQGNDIYVEIPVTIQEAILGTSILVPTIYGNVTLKVPAKSNNGTNLRLKGKGISPKGDSIFGDQYVLLKVMLPEKIDDKLIEFIESWAKNNDYNPRKKFKIN